MRVADYLVCTGSRTPGSPVFLRCDVRGPGPLIATPLVFLREARALRQLASAGAVDLVHLFVGDKLSLLRKCAFARIAHSCRLPYLLHLHAANLGPFLGRLPLASIRWLRATFLAAAGIVVLGKGAKELLCATLGIPAERVRIIPNGVEAPHLLAAPPREAAKTLLFLANLSRRKGLHDLLSALDQPCLRKQSVRLVVAGGGNIRRYQARASALDLLDRVEFVGWRSRAEVTTLLCRAHLLVLPSYAEALPLAVLEALAHGVPVVTTDVGETSSYVSDGRDVLFVATGNPVVLADVTARGLEHEALAPSLARNGREAYEKFFRIETFFESMLECYSQCVTAPAARGGYSPRRG